MTRVFQKHYGSAAKLIDCDEHGGGAGAELFIVEGDSAAAAVARVRDARHQAVLPMQGKPLNVLRAHRTKVDEHPLFGPLAAAIAAGLEAECDPRCSRYERILVLTDPDADGIHCGFLVLLFFQRFMRPLLEAGRIALVRPPWGEVVVAGELLLAFSEPELGALADRCRDRGSIVVRRYRGLAAIDAALIKEACVDPATRRTEAVSPADVASMIEIIEALGPETLRR
jgi:DNA gyrase subunit B/topoisomerase-4 subunit B